jgi:hypothetical protein
MKRSLERKIEVLEQFAEHAAIHHDRLWRLRHLARTPRPRALWALPSPYSPASCNCRDCLTSRGVLSKNAHVKIAYAVVLFLRGCGR